MSDWQLDRLPGDVRREAETGAQREGLPLHRWLGKLIHETCDEEGIPPGRELMRAAPSQAAGNGHRQQPIMPARPPVEPIRVPAQMRATEPARRAEQPAAAPANIRYRNGNGGGYAAPGMQPREATRAQEPPRRSERVAPVAREAAPSQHLPGQQELDQRVRQALRPLGARETFAQAATPVVRPGEPPRQPAPAAREPMAREPFAREPRPAMTSPAPSPAPVQAPPTRLSTMSSLSTVLPAATPPVPHGMPPTLPMQSASMPSRFAEPAPRPPRQEPLRQERAAPSASASQTTAASDKSVPAALRSDERLSSLAKLVQGLRRNELSPIGEARLFLKLMTEQMATIGDITVATGRTKEQVARSLRLLGLSDRLRDLIDRGALSREQAFALLDADDPDAANPVIPPSSGHRAP